MPEASILPLDNSTSPHDGLSVRVLLAENGSRRIAPAVLDLTSISHETTDPIRKAITAVTGMATANTVVSATHGSSTPHVAPRGTLVGAAGCVQNPVTAAKTAVAAAVENLKVARIGPATIAPARTHSAGRAG